MSNSDNSSYLAEAIKYLGNRIESLNQNITDTREAIDRMRSEVCKDIRNLQMNMLMVELEKVGARQEASNRLHSRVDEDLETVDNKYSEEKQKLRDEYSKAIIRIVDHLKEEIKVDVEPLQNVLSELDQINEGIVDPTRNIGNDFAQAFVSNYKNRLEKIEQTREKIVSNFSKFVKRRKELVTQIESLESKKIPVHSNLVLDIPFWFIGIENEFGQEEIVVLPILERFKPSSPASKTAPYVEHLHPPSDMSFEELTKDILSSYSKVVARANGERMNFESERSRNILEKMRQSGEIHESYVDAVTKFKEVFA